MSARNALVKAIKHTVLFLVNILPLIFNVWNDHNGIRWTARLKKAINFIFNERFIKDIAKQRIKRQLLRILVNSDHWNFNEEQLGSLIQPAADHLLDHDGICYQLKRNGMSEIMKCNHKIMYDSGSGINHNVLSTLVAVALVALRALRILKLW